MARQWRAARRAVSTSLTPTTKLQSAPSLREGEQPIDELAVPEITMGTTLVIEGSTAWCILVTITQEVSLVRCLLADAIVNIEKKRRAVAGISRTAVVILDSSQPVYRSSCDAVESRDTGANLFGRQAFHDVDFAETAFAAAGDYATT